MVCESCLKLIDPLCVPDKWKDGSRNNIGSSSSLKVGKTNKALGKFKASNDYLPDKSTCRLCKSKIQHRMNYCNDCAHKKGNVPVYVCLLHG